MTQPDPSKYVTADRPVNRRTAGVHLAEPQAANGAAQERINAVAARARLGRPLVELAGSPAASAVGRTRPLTILGSMVGAFGGVALVLAGLESSVLWLGGGASLLLAAVALLRRARPQASPAEAVAAPLLDEATLSRLDDALTAVVTELDEATTADVMALKAAIARLAVLRPVVDEHFTLDDRMYVVECVRRYLPDSLQSFLAVPREHRHSQVLESGGTASAMLREQLQLLRAGLEQREGRAAQSAAGQLLRQQRFLAAKR